MSTSTLAAPTQNMQINNNLYVGKGFLPNIQQAVNFGVTQTTADGQGYRIIIPAGYMGSDTIAAVVNGSVSVLIEDQRATNPLYYLWSNNSYVGGILSLNGIMPADATIETRGHSLTIEHVPPPATPASGLNADGHLFIYCNSGQDTSGVTGQTGGYGAFGVLAGGPGGAAPAGSTNGDGGDLNIRGGWAGTGAGTPGAPGNVHIQDPFNSPGPAGVTFIGGGAPSDATIIEPGGALSSPSATIDALTTPAIASPAGQPLMVESPVAVVLQGRAGDGATYIGGTNAAATVVQPGGAIASPSANFAACEVGNSPVRTFANTPDGPEGPDYPPAGIGVSTGTAWDVDSIDPATLATYPAAGIAVSDGDAWGTPIDPASVPLLDDDLSLPIPEGNVLIGGTNWPITADALPARAGGLLLGWNATTQFGSQEESDFINVCDPAAVNGGFAWWNVPPGKVIDGTVAAIMSLDKNGNLTVKTIGNALNFFPSGGIATWPTGLPDPGKASLTVAGRLCVVGEQGLATGTFTPPNNGGFQSWNLTAGNAETDFVNVAGASAAPQGFRWYNIAPGSTVAPATAPIMGVDQSGNLETAGNMDAAGTITAGGGGNLLIGNGGIVGTTAGQLTLSGNFVNIQVGGSGVSGAGSTWFFPSGGVEIGGFNNDPGAGSLYCTGTITSAGAKAFKIIHPQDSSKYLIHACLEGPEIAVFYRGEGQTDEDGLATITLPDYFEALTAKTGRTVQLTELIEDDDAEIGKVSATRVKDGKFGVRSEYASQRFYWEVKAVRADVDPLIITADIERV